MAGLIAALPLEVYSPDQLGIAAMELESYVASARDAAIRAQHNSADNQAAEQTVQLSPLLTSLIKAANVAPNNLAALEQLAAELETLRRSAPVVHLILAAAPTPSLKQRFTAWFRQEISPMVLVTFATRSDLGGGVVIQTASHIYDHSFRRRIIENKARIAGRV